MELCQLEIRQMIWPYLGFGALAALELAGKGLCAGIPYHTLKVTHVKERDRDARRLCGQLWKARQVISDLVAMGWRITKASYQRDIQACIVEAGNLLSEFLESTWERMAISSDGLVWPAYGDAGYGVQPIEWPRTSFLDAQA